MLENSSSKIIPEKNTFLLNGLNTLDIIKIRQHILNNQPFNQPEQWIAADVNKSGTISVADMAEIRQLILGNTTHFKNNTSWRFVDVTYSFDKEDPLKGTAAEFATISQLAEGEFVNFTAIKIGDVDDSAIPNSIISTEAKNSDKVLTLTLDDTQLKTGDTYTATFVTENFNTLQGYQLSLQSDALSIEKVKSQFGGNNNFGLTQLNKGLFSTSWNRTAPLKEEVPVTASLFQVTFKAQKDGLLSELLTLTQQPTSVEAYDLEGNIMDIELKFNPFYEQKPFELYQNEPNPFKSETTIGFYLPEDSEIELVFRDESGRVLKTIKEEKNAGFNSLKFDEKDFARGLIFYQLDTKFGSQNRKMLRLE